MSDDPAQAPSQVSPLIHATFEKYVRRRVDYYTNERALLSALLKKDAVIYALRGTRTIEEYVAAAFAAHESSSEETMWGNSWQQAISLVSPNTVGGGDLRAERDGTLWIIQVKSSIEQNYSAEAQDLRVLRTKLLAERDQHPGRRNVKAMLGIIRGDPRDDWRIYRANAEANKDIDGFQYQYMVGLPFRRWVSAEFEPAELIAEMANLSLELRAARESCLASLTQSVRARLTANGLPEDISGILQLTA